MTKEQPKLLAAVEEIKANNISFDDFEISQYHSPDAEAKLRAFAIYSAIEGAS